MGEVTDSGPVVSGVRTLLSISLKAVELVDVAGVTGGKMVTGGNSGEPVPAGAEPDATGADPVSTGVLVAPAVAEDTTDDEVDFNSGGVRTGRMPCLVVGVAEAGSVPTALVGETPGAVDESCVLLDSAVLPCEAG